MRGELVLWVLIAGCGGSSFNNIGESEPQRPRVASLDAGAGPRADWSGPSVEPHPIASDASSAVDAGIAADVDATVDATNNWEKVGTDDDKGVQVEEENGVQVVHSPRPTWCLVGGNAPGVCSIDRCAELVKKQGGRCEKQPAWACETHVLRTTGKRVVNCFSSYGLCDQVAESLSRNPEAGDVSACVIFRTP